MNRHTARETALKTLFQIDVGKITKEKAFDAAIEEDRIQEPLLGFARSIVFGVIDNLKRVDDILAKYSTGWNIARMAAIDRNILRMAIYEFSLAEPSVPIPVVVNEAVELAKSYGDSESGRFVNGVLANVIKGIGTLGAL